MREAPEVSPMMPRILRRIAMSIAAAAKSAMGEPMSVAIAAERMPERPRREKPISIELDPHQIWHFRKTFREVGSATFADVRTPLAIRLETTRHGYVISYFDLEKRFFQRIEQYKYRKSALSDPAGMVIVSFELAVEGEDFRPLRFYRPAVRPVPPDFEDFSGAVKSVPSPVSPNG